MESSLVTFMDDLLDFASDIGEEDDDVPGRRKPLAFSLKPKPAAATAAAASGLNAFLTDDSCRLLPDYAEEELEWLSNSDAFPAVETFVDILSEQQPPSVSKHNSPVSVLENSSSSSHSDNNSKASIHSSVLMSCCGSLKVPGKARSKRRRKHVSAHQLWFKQPTTRSAKQVLPPTPATAPTTAASGSAIGRKCLHCGAEKTPQWRAGPLGPKTLCNACGVRFKSGRLVQEYRPASSPSFSPDLHSNSHRKVMEMRRQKQFGMLVNPMDKG